MSLIIQTKPNKDAIPIATIECSHNGKQNKRYVYVSFDETFEETSGVDSKSDDSKNQSEFKEYKVKQGEKVVWHPYVLENQRFACFISGVSGSGKSTFASEAIKELRKQPRFKKFPVFFISIKDANNPENADPAFADIKDFNPIDIYRDEFLDVDGSDFCDCIVLFDDYNQLAKTDPKYQKIMSLLKKLLALGRKQNTMILIINHQTMDYNKTRDIIFESDTICCFPRSNLNSTKKFIKSYISDDKNLLEEIVNIKGSQFTPLIIHKTAPQYLITPKWIKLF